MTVVLALLPILEIGLYGLGIFLWLRRRASPYPAAAALALGIVSGLGLLSLALQVGFLLGWPEVAYGLELMGGVGLLWVNRAHWEDLREVWQRGWRLWQGFPVVGSLFVVEIAYLFLQAVLLPPSSWDAMTYHLPRVLLWAQNRSLFLRDFIISPQAAFPVGSDILYHLFFRWQTDYGLGIFSWLSYGVVGLCTYSLARPRVSRRIAVTTTLVILSLPEIVYQATGTKNDLLLAAVALACVTWADRWLRQPEIESLLGLGLTLCFGVAVKTSFVFFAFFFLLLWLGWVIQRQKGWVLLRLLVDHWRWVALAILPALVLSQGWLFWDNYQQFRSWLGPPKFALNSQNPDGLWGALANLVRYGFQSFHLLAPADRGWQVLFGWSMTAGLQAIYDTVFAPAFGDAGRSQIGLEVPFEITWQAQEDLSWFGPLSVFVVMPAIAWCAVRGRSLSRITALVALCITGVIAYKIGWSPWKSRFFSLVFVLGGPCVAVCLQRLQARRWLLGTLRILSAAILCYACLFNVQKPIFPSSAHLVQQNIWSLSSWTRDRLIYDRLYGSNRVEAFQGMTEPGSRVAIVGYDHYFPFMFHSANQTFTLLLTEKTPDKTAQSLAKVAQKLQSADYLLCFQLPCKSGADAISLSPVLKDRPGDKLLEIYEISSAPP